MESFLFIPEYCLSCGQENFFCFCTAEEIAAAERDFDDYMSFQENWPPQNEEVCFYDSELEGVMASYC
jgi:hypothetical protein